LIAVHRWPDGRGLGIDRGHGLAIRPEERLAGIAVGGNFDRCAAHPELNHDGTVAEPLDLIVARWTLLI
jgi:hypothetical protein